MKIILFLFCYLFFSLKILSSDKCFPRVFEIDAKIYYASINISEALIRIVVDLNSKKQYTLISNLGNSKDFENDVSTVLLLRYDLKKGYYYNVEHKSCSSYPLTDDVKKKKKIKKKLIKKNLDERNLFTS
jgi:hypothetical protein